MKRTIASLLSVVALAGACGLALWLNRSEMRGTPGGLAPGHLNPRRAKREEVSTTLDFGGARLFRRTGDPGRAAWAPPELFMSREGFEDPVTSASDLARFVREFRGPADGDEFWRLVQSCELGLELADVSAEARLRRAERRTPEPPDDPPGFWWTDYDRGIGGGRPSSHTGPAELPSVTVAWPWGPRLRLAAAPKLESFSSGTLVYRIRVAKSSEAASDALASLAPGKMTVTPVTPERYK